MEYFCVHSIRVNFACLFVWYTRHFHSAQRRTAGFGSQRGRDGAGRSSMGCSSAIDCSPPHFRRASQHRCHLSPITPYQMATLLHYWPAPYKQRCVRREPFSALCIGMYIDSAIMKYIYTYPGPWLSIFNSLYRIWNGRPISGTQHGYVHTEIKSCRRLLLLNSR